MTTPEALPTPQPAVPAVNQPAAKKPAIKKVASQEAAVKTPAVPKRAAAKTAASPAKKSTAPKTPVAEKVVAPPVVKSAAVKKHLASKSAEQKAIAPVKPAKVTKPAKLKIVRDSFTMPEADFALIDQIKRRALSWKQPAKKSEVLRAALQALQALPDAKVRQLLGGLSPIKKGRPQKAG